ncbi:MAG: hypothetical protein K8S14_08365 [Actinomycetia bacterium]|nr:hypothetical protein [Actinomycetes bacterium]
MEETFIKLLLKNIEQFNNQDQNSFESFYEYEGINNAITTMRVSIGTKKKLKKYLRSGESYEDIILRLIETNDSLKEENKYLKEFEKHNKSLINYIERDFQRAKKTFIYHPDLKIEYSYNESKVKFYGGFSFNLEMDNFILQGRPISEWKGIKTIQMIDIIKSPKKRDNKKNILKSETEFIKTKYLIYFKILFFVINKKIDKKMNEFDFLDLDFWKELYCFKNLPDSSLEKDVIQKLNRFELELEQIKTDVERKVWKNMKLKE